MKMGRPSPRPSPRPSFVEGERPEEDVVVGLLAVAALAACWASVVVVRVVLVVRREVVSVVWEGVVVIVIVVQEGVVVGVVGREGVVSMEVGREVVVVVVEKDGGVVERGTVVEGEVDVVPGTVELPLVLTIGFTTWKVSPFSPAPGTPIFPGDSRSKWKRSETPGSNASIGVTTHAYSVMSERLSKK